MLTGKHRAAWEALYRKCDGIIFVLDTTDKLRLAVVREELTLMLSREDLEMVPIVFLANKVDAEGALDCTSSIIKALGLDDICDRRWRIYQSNAITGEGLTDAIDWFTGEIKNHKKRNKFTA